MMRLLTILLVAAAAAASLHGALQAIHPHMHMAPDPWVDAWAAGGLKAQLRFISTEPHLQFHYIDARPLLRGPAFAGTVLRSYFVGGVSVQVAEFPRPELFLMQIPEGRHLDYCPPGLENRAHVTRVGRRMLIASCFIRRTPWSATGAPLPLVNRILDAFEAAARERP